MVPRAPRLVTIGSAAKNVPVNVRPGLVAESAPTAGFTITFVEVPTSDFNVAQVSELAKLA
jgi:hypothetical protein